MAKYQTLSEEQRVVLQNMDVKAQAFLEKMRADVMTDPAIKDGMMYILKQAKLQTPEIGHKRIGQMLAQLAKELL